jgi:hypothetical protein
MPKQIPLQDNWTLQEDENEIALNEAASWELQSIADNHADFKRLLIGDQPKRVRLRLATESPPANCKKLFDCALTVESKPVDVTVYRET